MSSTSLLFDLRHVQQQADASFSAKCATLTLPQFMVLDAVSRARECTQTKIVEMTGIDRSTLSVLVTRLAKAELLTVIVDENDKRAHMVSLSAKGDAAFKGARNAARAATQAARKRLREIAA
jgi:DNA-binding MarR family transcriptional regulator